MRFEIGDYVKCIENNLGSLTYGKTYVVTELGGNGEVQGIKVKNDFGYIIYYFAFRFELDICLIRNCMIDNILE